MVSSWGTPLNQVLFDPLGILKDKEITHKLLVFGLP